MHIDVLNIVNKICLSVKYDIFELFYRFKDGQWEFGCVSLDILTSLFQ